VHAINNKHWSVKDTCKLPNFQFPIHTINIDQKNNQLIVHGNSKDLFVIQLDVFDVVKKL
jgi:hypothetical protein